MPLVALAMEFLYKNKFTELFFITLHLLTAQLVDQSLPNMQVGFIAYSSIVSFRTLLLPWMFLPARLSNVNFVAGCLVIISLAFTKMKRNALAGMALGLASYIGIYPVAFLPSLMTIPESHSKLALFTGFSFTQLLL